MSSLSWTAGTKLIGQLVTWAITIFVIRILSPQDYGLVSMAGVFIYVLVLINELGLGAALVQTDKLEGAVVRQTYGLVLIANFCLFAILLAGAPFIARFYHEPRLTAIVQVSALQFLLTAFSIIPRSMLQRSLDYKKIGLVDLAGNVIGGFATLAMAWGGIGVWSLIAGSLITNLTRSVLLVASAPRLGMPDFSLKGMGAALQFGTVVTLERVFWFASSSADIMIVGKVLGKELLGFYSVAMELASLPVSKISDIVSQVAFSAFSRIQDDKEKVAAYFLKSCRLMSVISFPVFFGIASVSEEIVRIFLGEKWSPAILPLRILCLIMPMRIVMIIVVPLTQGLGKPHLGLYNVVAATFIRIPGFLIGAHWGMEGVSLSWVVTTPFLFAYFLSMVLSVIRASFWELLWNLGRPALLSALMYVSVAAARSLCGAWEAPLVVRFVILIAVGAATYLGLTLAFQRDAVTEMRALAKRES